MSNAIRSLIVKVGADTNDFSKKMKYLSSDLNKMSKSFGNAGAALTKSVTVPVAGVTAAIVKFGTDFEDSLAKVSTIADTSKKSLDDIKGEVLKVSTATGTAASEINEALYQAISAGADTANAMGLVEVAVKAAKGGFTDTATAVDGLTSVLNTYNMETKDAEDLANKFLVTQNKGKTTFGELASSIGKVAPTAAAVGVSVDELLAGIASLTANGIATSESVSGMKAAFANIIKPTKDAADMAAQLGIDFSAAALESKGLAGFLQEIKEKAGGDTEKMAKLFGSVEALNAMLTLTSDNGMTLMNDTLSEMETNSTAVDDAFGKISGTSTEQFKKMMNELKNIGIQLSGSLMPILNKVLQDYVKPFVKKIGELADKFQELSPKQQDFIIKMVLAAAALGPFLTILSKILKTGSTFLKTGSKLVKAFSTVGDASAAAAGPGKLLKFVGVLKNLIGPAGVLALVALGCWAIYEAIEGISAGIEDVKNGATTEDIVKKQSIQDQVQFSGYTTSMITQEKKNTPNSMGDFKALADGGIVTRPTFALVGEAGPEAVIPLKESKGMGGITININGPISGEREATRVGNQIVRQLKLAGVNV